MTAPKLIGERYEIGELLGYGGMAEVHRGRDVRLGREVAVKVLRSDLARDPSFQNRFRREAQSAAGLNHPSIVAVYDTGEDLATSGRTPYIVMEFVEGRTLREVLKSEGRLPPRRAMEITAEVCAALDFSHRAGIVHRDIKPGNVMITNSGAVKVMDFGIARALADNAATQTATSAVIGTAQYLSPEQARGESVDARSDVYSTGCLLYELLVGHPPFNGDSPVAVAYQHVRETAQIPSSVNRDIPPALDSIVMKALAKNPMNRYQTAAAMRTDLQRAIAGQQVEAESVMTDSERTQFMAAAPAKPAPRPGVLTPVYDDENDTRSHRGAVIWTAVIVALLLVIGVTAYLVLRDTGKNAPTTAAVPSLAGLSPAAARDQIRAANLTVGSGDPQNSNGPCTSGPQSAVLTNPTKGNVCTQDPAAGTQAALNDPVTFTIYAGPKPVSVPLVKQLSFKDAQSQLGKVGLLASRVNVNSTDPAGTVLDQDPEPFNEVAPNSTVKLSVSTGTLKIPDGLLKLTKQQAQTKLNVANFFNIAYVDSVVQDGYQVGQVMGVDPASGSSIDPKTKITLTIATPKPTCVTSSPPPASPTASGPSASKSPSASSTAPSSSPSATPSC